MAAARRQRSFCLVSAGVFYSALHTDSVGVRGQSCSKSPPQPMLVCYFAIHFNGTPPAAAVQIPLEFYFPKATARLPPRLCVRTDLFPCIFATTGENRFRPAPLPRSDVEWPLYSNTILLCERQYSRKVRKCVSDIGRTFLKLNDKELFLR